MSSDIRVSIPGNVKKTIQNIKEIAGNHADDEIYAMLKDCSMDPNETAQKLLLQDTFHEVKRKRDKRKENLSNKESTDSRYKESTDSRWRPGAQGRGGRSARGNFPPRQISQDAGGGRSVGTGRDNGVNQGSEKGGTPFTTSQESENKATNLVSSPATVMVNGAKSVVNGGFGHGRASQTAAGNCTTPLEESSSVGVNKVGDTPAPPGNTKGAPPSGVIKPSSDPLGSPASVLGVYSSASDPVLVPSVDSRVPGAVGTIRREVRSQRAATESNATILSESISIVSQELTDGPQINRLVTPDISNSELSSSINEKAPTEIENTFNGNIPNKNFEVEKNQHLESLEPSSSSNPGGSSTSRPSSNYGSRSQQLIGSQKAVGPSKEWKPKPVNSNPAPASGAVGSSKVDPVTVEAGVQSLPISNATASKEAASKLQKKLEELHFSDRQHVIIPNHLQVPESERSGLSFGSFDATFGVSTSNANDPDTDKSSTPPSESSQGVEENAEEPSSSNQNASQTVQEGDYSDHTQSPTDVPETISPGEANVSSSAVPDYDQSKSETVLPPGGPQYSVVHTAPNYSTFGLMPPMLGTQFAPFDSSEPQGRDVSRLPGFVVQQPFDPSASYYTQFYRPGADGDGRFSPFLAPGAATKYNGNIALLSSQPGQSPQESGNSLVLSTAGPTPLATQAAGVMQSSIAVNQQPVPVFRQPAGVHMPHYPPNYLPYSQYFSPFYVPPPTIHHFLSNTYPQQPPTGNVYPPPPAAAAAAATGIKYSLSQYKPGSNTGNTTHIGMQTGYAQYSSSPAGYNPSPAATTGNSTGNEDISAAQYKENNVYITGQQSEGSAVWVPAPGRDMSGMQASSFYNLSPQGQHVTFAPTQAGHAAFAGIYHPQQTVAAATVHPLMQQSQTMAGPVEMVGPPAGVYQQPQRAQINWTNNY